MKFVFTIILMTINNEAALLVDQVVSIKQKNNNDTVFLQHMTCTDIFEMECTIILFQTYQHENIRIKLRYFDICHQNIFSV